MITYSQAHLSENALWSQGKITRTSRHCSMQFKGETAPALPPIPNRSLQDTFAIGAWAINSYQSTRQCQQRSSIQLCGSGIPSARLVLARLQTLHIFNAQLEIKHLRVFLDSGMGHAFWQDNKAFLQAPTE
jgi:hypothetical protein